MESFPYITLKVKYGEIIRRFSVRVLDNNKPDLDINRLRGKIRYLLNFSDNDFTMTYIDEDGDRVSLVNDDDLHDMMSQQLRPLRMNVHLGNEKSNQFHDRLDGSSTSQMPAARSRTGGSEALKSLPEPETLSELLLDAASKAMVTSHAHSEFSKSLARLAKVLGNSDVQSPSAPETSTQNVATESFKTDPSRSACKDSKMINRGSATKNIRVDAPYFPSVTHLDDDKINDSFLSWRHSLSGVPPMATGPSMLGTVGAYPEIYRSGYVETMVPNSPMIRSSGCIKSTESVFHTGVMCDGCGARPIIGPRFKSKLKHNYDLCSICFGEMRNEAEYIRIDYPSSCWYPRMQAFNHRHPFPDPQIIDNTLRSSKKQTELDSCFVADVNVLDDTMMPPLTPFTKIWRLRNTGSSNWPRGTKLEWVRGLKFGPSASIEIEVPARGVPVGQEIDVAVKFISPPLSGHFSSYWMLASPSGQRFGKHIWVIIQVDTALERPDTQFFQGLDLNLPPTEISSSSDLDGHEDGVFFYAPDPSSIAKPVKPDHNLPVSGTEQRFVVNDKSSAATFAEEEEDNLVSSPTVDNHGYLPSSTTKVPSVSYPLVDFFEPIPDAFPPKVSVSRSSEKVSSKNHHNVEAILLRALEDMGFKQMDLNKEVLKMTGYDLEKAVDELCGVAEWDPMIQELEEMVGI